MTDEPEAEGGAWSPRGTEAAKSQARPIKEQRRAHVDFSNANTMPMAQLEIEITKIKGQIQDKQRIRALESAAFFSWLGPSQLSDAAEAKAKEHADKYRGQPNHKGGAPFIHAYRHLLAAMVAHADDPEAEPLKAEMQTIRTHLHRLENEQKPAEAYLSVRYCKIMTCRSEAARGKSVVTFAVSQVADDFKEMTRALLRVAAVGFGCEVCQGSAPRSPIERAPADELDRLQKIHARRTGK